MSQIKQIKIVLIILAIYCCNNTLAAKTTQQEADQNNKKIVMTTLANNWLEVAQQQYQKGYLKHAKKSLESAKEYQKYLTPKKLKQLNLLIEKVEKTTVNQQLATKHIDRGRELLTLKKALRAKAHFEQAEKLIESEHEQKQLKKDMAVLKEKIAEKKRQVAQLYNQSVDFYYDGKLEQARKGFIQVAGNGLMVAPKNKTAEDYLLKIDGILANQIQKQLDVTAFEQKQNSVYKIEKTVEMDKAEADGIDHNVLPIMLLEDGVAKENSEPIEMTIEEVTKKSDQARKDLTKLAEATGESKASVKKEPIQKKTPLETYMDAVVKEAVTKVWSLIDKGQFEPARKIVANAQETLHKYQDKMTPEIFDDYANQLSQLAGEISKEEVRLLGNWDDKNAWRI